MSYQVFQSNATTKCISSCADRYRCSEYASAVLAKRQSGNVAARWMTLRAKLIVSYTAIHVIVTFAAQSWGDLRLNRRVVSPGTGPAVKCACREPFLGLIRGRNDNLREKVTDGQ